MHWMGGGLIIIVQYATGGGLSVQNAILTESNNEILTEAGSYLETETP